MVLLEQHHSVDHERCGRAGLLERVPWLRGRPCGRGGRNGVAGSGRLGRMQRRFRTVDVFTATSFGGNPVAVVLDSDGLSTGDMQRFANWTNLSETTFVLPPSGEQADYQVRIFTPSRELPFAAPPLIRSGPVEEPLAAHIAALLGISRDDITDLAWADNGPGWVAVLLPSVEAVLALRPVAGDMDIGGAAC